MISLYSINHDNPQRQEQPMGGIAKCFVVGLDDNGALAPCYADMRALFHVWRNYDHEIVGFHGYRKHLDLRGLRDVVPAWTQVGETTFRLYQSWLAASSEPEQIVLDLLDKHKIIVTPPYDFGCTMEEDFCRSRSTHDWNHLRHILARESPKYDFSSHKGYDYFFVTRWDTFDEYMTGWLGVMRELEPLVNGESPDPAYRTRYMAYLSQFYFSLWLEKNWNRLNPAIVSRIHCWDIH